MSDTKNHEITSQEGKELLKQIEDELPRIKLRSQDNHGNQEYEPNEILAAKVRELLVNLHMSVRYNTPPYSYSYSVSTAPRIYSVADSEPHNNP